ncbi:uncharacterized protein BDR25DRAFT_345149 [Lindgomyces ingoldianus]|uniref:Uncharacterized protein n=1 Tax=Lindgomyces ingoldianus TaxID=673940 RepID=A0ACB6QJ39_9PLEO|nr:uncharacterized protein BDR25DRAFT_345149 [Lindgomyces ingoldianus]KAF2466953.1 hypothetical protein BDR25DRAFT_345149 [Lindgomyces ingoldianus]
MAPSRGLHHLLYILNPQIALRNTRRTFSSFTETLANPTKKVQTYISRSTNPFLNLSIEDHILRTSSPSSVILFLYTNAPCVVIGRNQNPWLEVNLPILRPCPPKAQKSTGIEIGIEQPGLGPISLVRRRSGGGTVFHDKGNVNWSVTSPRVAFTRDKHAEMVVRALRKLGVGRARVNERHDIVLDQGKRGRDIDAMDTHRTPYMDETGEEMRKPLKVSGSAYKLTRGRALHHGTALLASPNLDVIPQYLHSPGKPFINAKGVESVSSPVGNIGLDTSVFQKQVSEQFAAMYGSGNERVPVQMVGEEHLYIPEIKKGYDELRTADWVYSQTPGFTVTNEISQDTHYNEKSRLASKIQTPDFQISMAVRHGVIKDCKIEETRVPIGELEAFQASLLEQKLQDIQDWPAFLHSKTSCESKELAAIAKWLGKILYTPEIPRD